MAKQAKRPTDVNQLAKNILDIATGESEDTVNTPDGKNAAAVYLGKMGGLKGGNARAVSLSAERRSEIAKKAANKRWHNNSL